MIEDLLLELGLKDKEIKVYLSIVKSEGISATELAKKTKLNRTTIYDIIENLIEKGLITQQIKEKKKTFQTVNFNKFISKLKDKEKIAYLAIRELNNLYIPSKKDYEVEVFEGVEGVKSYFDNVESLLKTKKLKDYLVFGSSLQTIKRIKFYIISRIKDSLLLLKNVDFRIIWNYSAKSEEIIKNLQFIKSKFLPKDVKTTCTTVIANDSIALFIYTNKPIIIKIKNKDVSETYKNHFNMSWDSL